MWWGVPLAFALIIGVAGALAYWRSRQPEPAPSAPAPVRVVRDRPGGARRPPGAKVNEAEAVRLLRRHMSQVKPECLAVMSNGYRGGGYQLTAVNGCTSKKLGRWRVDGKSGAVTQL